MTPHNTSNTNLQTFVLLVIIALTLLNTDYFYNATTAAYYGFCITVFLFAIASFFSLNNNEPFTFKMPILLLGLWSLYVLTNYFTGKATQVFTIYSIALYFLFLGTTVLFYHPNFKFSRLFIGIAVIATLESLYCLMQYVGFSESRGIYYKVTGSWNNPNVTAIFLALTVPFFLYLLRHKYKKIMLAGLILLLTTLLLLKCRAAFIGTLLSVIVYYGLEYQFIDWAKNKKNSTSVKALLVLSLIIIIPACSYLYNAKKDSADGRKFIWKLSAQMIPEKLLTGYGYGYFEKEYNLYQAAYIKSDNATTAELANVGPVIMPHNELLHNAVEGGSIGLVLIILFFGSLLFAIRKKEKTNLNEQDPAKRGFFNLAYAGTISFIVMSMVNSTIQIIPTMCLMVIYAAIICSTVKSSAFLKNHHLISMGTKTAIICISIYSVWLLFGLAAADRQNKKAQLLKDAGNYKETLQILSKLESTLKENSDYWQNYGHLYFKTQQFEQAAACFEKAKKYSSLPQIYLGAGKIHEKIKQYPQAIREYETLTALYPTKILYRMLLLEAYLKNKDTANAIAQAKEIIGFKPKVPSRKADQYKSRCRDLLRKLDAQKVNRKQQVQIQ